MGPEIFVISGFRNNRGQKSADLVIYEPRNNSSSNLSELGLFDFWILLIPRTKYHMSPVPTLYLVWFLSAVHVTHHSQQRITNTHTTAHALVVCETEVRPHTQTRQQQHYHHQNHHSSTPPAPHQHHSSRDSSKGGRGLTSPVTMYVPDFKNKRQTAKQDLLIQHETTFQKWEAIMGAPFFWCRYFWSLKTSKIITRKNRSFFFRVSRSYDSCSNNDLTC